MNSQRIEKLLEKYYNGETTLSEERELISFFEKGEVPGHMKSARDQFLYLSGAASEIVPEGGVEEKILRRINDNETLSLRRNRRTWVFIIGSAAASILLLATVFWHFNTFTKKMEDAMSDPEIAYNEARRIMFFVSEKLNKGTEQLESVHKVNKGIENTRPIGQFTIGLEEASRINEYNKVNKYINNPADLNDRQ